MKYKVGDKVRIVSEWRKGCYQNPTGEMDKWLGKVMTIRSIEYDISCYRMVEDECEHSCSGWYWFEDSIECLICKK